MLAVGCGNNRGQKCDGKGSRKESQVQEFSTEVQRMWNMKCMIIQVITGATRIVTKGLKKNLKALIGKHSIRSPQKTAILGTSHIMWKVLQCET
jgi:hypothetical protein